MSEDQTSAYALTGMPAAGKTTTAEMLSAVDFQVYEIGDTVREVIDEYDYEMSEIGDFLEDYKSENGQDALAQRTVERYEEEQEGYCTPVIAGLRQVEEREYLEKNFDNVETIAITADQRTRKERITNRGRKEDREGQSFEKRDIREWNTGVGDLIKKSDHIVVNEGSFEDLAGRLIDTFDFNPNLYEINMIEDQAGGHAYEIYFDVDRHQDQYSNSQNASSRDEIETDIQNFYTEMMIEAVK